MRADQLAKVAGAVIAGGKSQRFKQGPKALAKLGDLSLLENVFYRMLPQVARLWVNAREELPLPQSFAKYRIPDTLHHQAGPLLGILATLERATAEGFDWLIVCPCDTPFLPMDLTAKLLESCEKNSTDLAMAYSGERQHPSFSLWRKNLLDPLKEAVLQKSKYGYKQFYSAVPHSFAYWDAEPLDPFFNINYPQDLEKAHELLEKFPPIGERINHIPMSWP